MKISNKLKKTLNQDVALIDDAKAVMSRVNNGWYSQFIENQLQMLHLKSLK